MKKLAQLLIISSALLTAAAAQAHHSFAATFQPDAEITIEGVVTNYSFRNPHVLVSLDVTNEDGSVTGWVSEGSAATGLRRSNWSEDTLVPGDIVQITGDSTYDGSPMTSMANVKLLDPTTRAVVAVLLPAEDRPDRNAPTEAAPAMTAELSPGVPNLTGFWTATGMTGQPRPGSIVVPLNTAGQAAQAAYDNAHDPQIFCDVPGLVRMSSTPHPVQLTQFDDHIVIVYEELGTERNIYFDDSHFLGINSHMGDSIARYEDDTLIIETINLHANMANPVGHLISNQMTIVETYKRIDTPEYGPVLSLHTVVSDPVNLEEDYVMGMVKMSAGDYSFVEVDCQEPLRERSVVAESANFFLTSHGPGDGANLGGLEGADAHCEALAATVGQGDKNWVAYLSTSEVNARDRIAAGPYYNAKGVHVAFDLEDLHGDAANFIKADVTDERGQPVNGRGDEPNRHDILTGSDMSGMAVSSDADTTCSDWTSNGEGSALVGHFDRNGGGDNPTSWNSAHASRGCGQADLQGTGGDGLFYCFAADE